LASSKPNLMDINGLLMNEVYLLGLKGTQ